MPRGVAEDGAGAYQGGGEKRVRPEGMKQLKSASCPGQRAPLTLATHSRQRLRVHAAAATDGARRDKA